MSKKFLVVYSFSNTCHGPVAKSDFRLMEHIGQMLVIHRLRSLELVQEAQEQDLM